MLSVNSVLSKRKSFIVLLSGCAFNFVMAILNICPRENLSLALFNLMPVMPLDGGMIINLLFPSHAFVVSVVFIALLFILCIYLDIFPFTPVILLFIFIAGEKKRADRSISDKVIRHFRQK